MNNNLPALYSLQYLERYLECQKLDTQHQSDIRGGFGLQKVILYGGGAIKLAGSKICIVIYILPTKIAISITPLYAMNSASSFRCL